MKSWFPSLFVGLTFACFSLIVGCASDNSAHRGNYSSTPPAGTTNEWIYDTPPLTPAGSPATTTITTTTTAAPAVSTTPASTTTQVETLPTQLYVVQKGDSLWKIARLHNTTVDKVKALNGLSNDVIRVGQELKVPATAAAH